MGTGLLLCGAAGDSWSSPGWTGLSPNQRQGNPGIALLLENFYSLFQVFFKLENDYRLEVIMENTF